MTDTLFADISEYQVPVTDVYPYGLLTIRACDGTYRDHHFAANYAWAKNAINRGRIVGVIVYFVFEENWRQTLDTLKAMVGKPFDKLAILIDVESWGGKLQGDHSAQINACREEVIKWLNNARPLGTRLANRSRDRKRVIAYANEGDRNALWSKYGDAKWDIANYSYYPGLPDQIMHQFSSSFSTVPFGPCDINTVNGATPAEVAKLIGLTGAKIPTVKPKPIRRYPKFPLRGNRVYGVEGVGVSGVYGNKASRHNIALIQHLLVKHGYAGRVNAAQWCDGVFGPATADAVTRFKKDKMRTKNKSGYIGRYAWNRLVRL